MSVQQPFIIDPSSTNLFLPNLPEQKHQLHQKLIGYFSFVWESYKDKGLKEETIEFLMNSWRDKTKLQYKVYLKRWFEFSIESIENPLRSTLHYSIEFFTYLFR